MDFATAYFWSTVMVWPLMAIVAADRHYKWVGCGIAGFGIPWVGVCVIVILVTKTFPPLVMFQIAHERWWAALYWLGGLVNA